MAQGRRAGARRGGRDRRVLRGARHLRLPGRAVEAGPDRGGRRPGARDRRGARGHRGAGSLRAGGHP
ncbi:MAG: hypothetical protein EAS51_06120 [Microbacteriaceae bacterium]|nr:MAG: hypothetical protein EAS51_06120 [Microbacteriaceae bacterium]